MALGPFPRLSYRGEGGREQGASRPGAREAQAGRDSQGGRTAGRKLVRWEAWGEPDVRPCRLLPYDISCRHCCIKHDMQSIAMTYERVRAGLPGSLTVTGGHCHGTVVPSVVHSTALKLRADGICSKLSLTRSLHDLLVLW